jgi:peptidoglycan/xylan/chitin deacetylase (PgdA/CDA1 family)
MMPAARSLASAGVHLLARGLARRRLSVLMYHRVLPAPDPINTWDVTAAEFEGQMRALAAHFAPLPLGEAVARLARDALPPGAVCVTFDDGYADNLTQALPILQRHGIPATFFIATGYLNGGRMWNDTVVEAVRAAHGDHLDLQAIGLGRLPLGDGAARRATIEHILKSIKHRPAAQREQAMRHVVEQVGKPLPCDLMLTDAQLLALHRSGMEIGGHTAHHPILATLPAEAAREEIVAGRERLVELLRAPVTLFAYPNGKPTRDYRPEHVQMVREAGFTAAVSTADGVAGRGCDPFQLPRQPPWDRNPVTFSLRLAKSYLRAGSGVATAS